MSWPPEPTGTWVIDLDGVIWLAQEPIPGGASAVARLRQAGVGVLFATNNSSPTVATLVQRLARAGIEVGPDQVVSSAQAAASLVAPGERVHCLADDGVREALAERGAELVEGDSADVVLVGWTHAFDFDHLARAATTVRNGARLIGTNEDPTHPTPDGLLPGAGSLLISVATAAGATPEVAGKPHLPMAQLIRQRASDVTVGVGDRPSTDGALARQLGVPFALVHSGVASSEPAGAAPDVEAADFAALVDLFLAP
jgi:HAD superfamily hydrolase (TIGR01450 family)